MKLVSIIVPIYKTKIDSLKKSLDSLLLQSYKDIEILLVDGGSNEEVVEFLRIFSSKHNNVTVISTSKGVSHQRNIGLENCKGEYITFIDSDDYVNETYIQTLVESLEKNKYDVTISQSLRVEINKQPINEIKYNTSSPDQLVSDSNFFKYVRSSCFANIRNLYKKELIAETKFNEDMSYGEDLFFNYELSKKKFSAVFVEDAKYYYLVDTNINSASRRMDDKGIEIVNKLYLIYKVNKSVKNDNLVGICKEFSMNFNIFFYESAREKNKYILKKLSKYKWLYLKLNFNLKTVFYVLFPITIVKRRNKHV